MEHALQWDDILHAACLLKKKKLSEKNFEDLSHEEEKLLRGTLLG